jgi:hypothetical protein
MELKPIHTYNVLNAYFDKIKNIKDKTQLIIIHNKTLYKTQKISGTLYIPNPLPP